MPPGGISYHCKVAFFVVVWRWSHWQSCGICRLTSAGHWILLSLLLLFDYGYGWLRISGFEGTIPAGKTGTSCYKTPICGGYKAAGNTAMTLSWFWTVTCTLSHHPPATIPSTSRDTLSLQKCWYDPDETCYCNWSMRCRNTQCTHTFFWRLGLRERTFPWDSDRSRQRGQQRERKVSLWVRRRECWVMRVFSKDSLNDIVQHRVHHCSLSLSPVWSQLESVKVSVMKPNFRELVRICLVKPHVARSGKKQWWCKVREVSLWQDRNQCHHHVLHELYLYITKLFSVWHCGNNIITAWI